MHPHEELLHRFYQSFQRRDHAAMASCYHPRPPSTMLPFPSGVPISG
ncbi:hypothetical protein [Hymenobacter cellulosilyticus]|uniref:Nuclear transport factor 2 family protein n=1 Tax=Hymenobacter cellulosilyticus TaxID=2932248 RepID=A0A8T9QBW9_9BACT|nr:hypothetical protein [Hymenobacter cellulosilyticus]UOQ73618.1 hypothetical protein MUN79_06735 [Hymenobacter cellulosilyticus]